MTDMRHRQGVSEKWRSCEDTSRMTHTYSTTFPLLTDQGSYTQIQTLETTADIEHDILRHPELMAHSKAVSMYLNMDILTLQSIIFLRKGSQWSSELSAIYPTLFTSPPASLFDLIVKVRAYSLYDCRPILEQLRVLKTGGFALERRKPMCGRTAPEGQRYKCPSEKCKESFKKSGHANNHVSEKHPEYLKLFPDWEPQQVMVNDTKSAATPPGTQHQALSTAQARQSEPKHASRSTRKARPVSADWDASATTFAETPNQLIDSSPRSKRLSSPCSADEQPTLTHSRSTSRPSPRQITTPRDLEAVAYHSSALHLRAGMVHTQAKRGRDPTSSNESIVARAGVVTDGQPIEPSRRQSKRLSISNPDPFICWQ